MLNILVNMWPKYHTKLTIMNLSVFYVSVSTAVSFHYYNFDDLTLMHCKENNKYELKYKKQSTRATKFVKIPRKLSILFTNKLAWIKILMLNR